MINNTRILKCLFVILLLLVFSFFIYSILFGNIHISHIDEISYFNGARLFYETGSLKAPICCYGQRSVIGEFGWYGPAYHIIYGGLFKLFGFNPFVFYFFHFALYLLSLIIIGRLNFDINSKLVILICVAIFGPSLTYVFSFFPVTLHIFMGIFLTYILFNIDNKFYRNLYIITIFVFFIIHITFAMWILGLIPFSRNKKELTKNFFLTLIFLIMSFIYLKYFLAPSTVENGLAVIRDFWGYSSFIALQKNAIRNLVYINIKTNYTQIVIILMCLYLLAMLFYHYRNSSTKFNLFKCDFKIRLLYSGILISFSVFFSMILLYDCRDFFLIKQTSSFFTLLITIIVLNNRKTILFLLIIFIFGLPGVFSQAYSTMKEKRDTYLLVNNDPVLNSEIEKIKTLKKSDNAEIEIFIDKMLFEMHQGIDVSIFPNSNYWGDPILYSLGVGEGIYYDFLKSLNFALEQGIFDYVICKDTLDYGNLELLFSNNFFKVYKVLKNN